MDPDKVVDGMRFVGALGGESCVAPKLYNATDATIKLNACQIFDSSIGPMFLITLGFRLDVKSTSQLGLCEKASAAIEHAVRRSNLRPGNGAGHKEHGEQTGRMVNGGHYLQLLVNIGLKHLDVLFVVLDVIQPVWLFSISADLL